MSMSGAEKAGVAGAMLLAAGVTAAVLLFLLPGAVTRKGRAEADPDGPGGDAGTTAAVPGDPAPEPIPGPGTGGPRAEPPASSADLRRELDRLRSLLAREQERSAALEARLKEAGLAPSEVPEDPAVLAAVAIDDLRSCGPESSPLDVDRLVDSLIKLKDGAIETVKRALDQDLDVAYSDSWRWFSGQFNGYPSFRIALFDALNRIGGVEGQAALVGQLRKTRAPMETLVLLTMLSPIRNVPSVDDARIEAARRYAAGEPEPREFLLRPALMEVLSGQEPETAAGDLVAYAVRAGRHPDGVGAALDQIGELPAACALRTLAGLALREDAPGAAVPAATRLAARGEAEAAPALRPVLEGAQPPVRLAVYRALPEPVEQLARELERHAGRGGLEVLARLERLEAELAARSKILDDRAGAETEGDLLRAVDAARGALKALAERTGKLGASIRGK